MATIGKTKRPKIYTESDQILIDLKTELIDLKSRMYSIEEEQEQNRNLMDKLSFHENMANEMIANHQKEIKNNSDNFNVIADVMKSLKSPVSDVVDNLSEVISEIDDNKTRETLNECINTASNVLNSFSDIEDFCLSAGSDGSDVRKTVNIRELFKEKLSKLKHQPNS